MKIEISSFSRKFDIESFLDWVFEVEKFFDMAYVPKEKHIKFVAYKLKGGAATWWDHKKAPRQTACDDVAVYETTFSR